MKDDRVYLRHILRCIARIEEYTRNGRQEFLSSPMIQDAVIRNLQTLAESSRRLSETSTAMRPDVDWRAIAGLRNVLVHDYLGIDLDQIYRVIEQDLPPYRSACTAILQKLDEEKSP